jgi:murein DD-endopeptidase MepM/ murein hydrolase activator NlpD
MYEIQFHPADIRKQVRYFFVSRRTFRWMVGIAVTVALLLVAGTVLAPLGVQSLLLSSKLRALRQQNELHRQVLDQRIRALEAMERQARMARSRQEQMSLILGAPQSHERGLGGFPSSADGSVDVVEARDALDRATTLATETRALLTLADELASFASAHEDLAAAVPAICPVEIGSFVLTSPFGNRISPFTNTSDFHSGIDLAAREGTPVMSAGGGRVVFAGRFPLSRNVRWWRYGNVIVITHGGRYVTIYAHLQDISVRRGQQVARGDVIGTVGNTGWSTSPHLHYEVRVDGVPQNPMNFVLPEVVP